MVGPISRGALSKGMHHRQQSTVQESPATRPEDLRVTPWYLDELGNETSSPGGCERGSYPSSYYSRQESGLVGRPDLYSTRDSSIESSDVPRAGACAPRKAYMDLTDAIALLDETCPNQEASPSLTPRTPRTPLTPFPRSKRARSKSSDNSSNYSNERLSDRSLETSKSQDKERRRPFLRKIGISKTEDRPFLAKIIAPRITGKPYLEKIGPSKAVEKPFLEKIGSSKTLDKFTFDTLRELPRAMVRRCQPIEPSPLSVERARTHEDVEDDVIVIVKDEKEEEEHRELEEELEEEEEEEEEKEDQQQQQQHQQKELILTAGVIRTGSRRANGKGYLLKMYSFETEDLDESTAALKAHRDPLRGASLDDVLDSGPSSLPPSGDSHEHVSPRFKDLHDDRSTSVAELVTCRVTTSEEIFSSSSRLHLSSPGEATSWGNSPLWPKRRSRRVASTPRTRADRDISSVEVFPSDDSTPNSPTKRRISRLSPETEENRRIVVSRTKNSSLPRDLNASPSKTRRQASEEPCDTKENVEVSKSSRHSSEERLEGLTNITRSKSNETRRQTSEGSDVDNKIELVNLVESKSRRQIFDEAVEKFGGSEYIATRTRRQVSEEILDRNKENKKNNDCGRLDDPQSRFERRGISSDNLKLSRETVVVSMPSASSLGYQSGDSSLTSQRSSNHSQDFIRGTFKMLHDKFELQDVPVESYAAFKRRTRANHNLHHQTTIRDKNEALTETTKIPLDVEAKDDSENLETTTTTNLTTDSEDSKDSTHSASEDATESKSSITVKSVLRKQEGVDHHSDHEAESSCSLRRPKRRIFHEPSQETMDLLTELRKVKSLLGTPSTDRDMDLEFSKPVRFPKKILLTDKEFCLSVERENSIRRPSILHLQQDSAIGKRDEDLKSLSDNHNKGSSDDSGNARTIGPALFEKRCLSLDYADDDKPPKPEARAISLASARSPRSGTEGTIDSSDAGLVDDAKSYCSEVFTTPSDGPEDIERLKPQSSEETSESKPQNSNHCGELDIAIPVDQLGSGSPKRRIHMQGRTSDLYEIISPRSTPFRVKKRLGRISVEETVKQESFTLNKVDCRSVATQKRTKCIPL